MPLPIIAIELCILAAALVGCGWAVWDLFTLDADALGEFEE